MRLSVHHVTRFTFDQPSGHSIHDVRLTPKPAAAQRIVSWHIDGPAKEMIQDSPGGGSARLKAITLPENGIVEVNVRSQVTSGNGTMALIVEGNISSTSVLLAVQ